MSEPVFHLPTDLAQALVDSGEAVPYRPQASAGGAMLAWGDAAGVALVLLGHGADIVAITGVRPPLAPLVERLRSWRGSRPSAPEGFQHDYGLLAVTPKGQLRVDLADPPDEDAVLALLAQLYDTE